MKRLTIREWVAIGIALGVIVLFLGGMFVDSFMQSAYTTDTNEANNAAATEPATTTMDNIAPQGNLIVQDLVIGKGKEAKSGDTITVNYTGAFENGQVFDSSKSHGQPFTFVLGQGMVIKGWDEGVVGMKVGGKRKLVIPPTLAYGDQEIGPIPANSTLVFEVELLDVK